MNESSKFRILFHLQQQQKSKNNLLQMQFYFFISISLKKWKKKCDKMHYRHPNDTLYIFLIAFLCFCELIFFGWWSRWCFVETTKCHSDLHSEFFSLKNVLITFYSLFSSKKNCVRLSYVTIHREYETCAKSGALSTIWKNFVERKKNRISTEQLYSN